MTLTENPNEECIKLRREYIDHLNMPNKQPIQEWENKRKEIHEKIFRVIGVDRKSKEGKEFSKKFDKSIELELKSLNEIFAKRISNCEIKEEMDLETRKLEFIKKWSKRWQ